MLFLRPRHILAMPKVWPRLACVPKMQPRCFVLFHLTLASVTILLEEFLNQVVNKFANIFQDTPKICLKISIDNSAPPFQERVQCDHEEISHKFKVKHYFVQHKNRNKERRKESIGGKTQTRHRQT